MKIFLLEDEFVLQDMIKEYLQGVGFEVLSCSDGLQAEEMLYEERFDVLLLDVSVPHIDGFELLSALRDRGIKTPAIYITAKSDLTSVKDGYKAGCDDYIKKPFELEELLLRIQSIAKRGYSHAQNMIEISDGVTFDTQNEQLFRSSKRVELHTKELKALKTLLKNRGKVVSRGELVAEIWGEMEDVSSEALRAQIKNLRKALGVDIIKNIRNEGYIIE